LFLRIINVWILIAEILLCNASFSFSLLNLSSSAILSGELAEVLLDVELKQQKHYASGFQMRFKVLCRIFKHPCEKNNANG